MKVVKVQIGIPGLVASVLVSVAGIGILQGAELHLKRRDISHSAGERPILEAPGPRWTGEGRSHLILQFRHPVDERLVRNLNRRGAYVVGAVPDFGVVVSADDAFSLDDSDAVEKVDGGLDVAWASRMSADDKISPLLTGSGDPVNTWFIAELFEDVNRADAARLAEAAGFQVHAHRDLAPSHLLLSGPTERLTGLAQWDEVAYLFPASPAMVRGRRLIRCAGALTTGGTTPQFVLSGSGWPKDASGSVTLSYVFGPMTPKLEAGQARQEVERALNAWTAYAPVKFLPGTTGTGGTAARTVYVWFASRDHADGFPFDGPGGILAHTFYPAPPNPEPVAGDMHFDADEAWHIGANTDLFTVAVHEVGHALGLAHTDNPASIMYPYYRLGAQISTDDIAGIQKLYGAAAVETAPIPPPAPAALPLTLTISSPVSTSATANASIAMAGNTANGTGTVHVTWQTDHGEAGSTSGSNPWSVAGVPLANGGNTITVTASDSSGKAVQTVRVTRLTQVGSPASVDRTPPSITISFPAASISSTLGSTVTVNGTAADNVGVVKVTWQTGGVTGTASGTTNWSANSIPLLVGNNAIAIRAFDAAGNMSWRSLLVIRR